MSNFTFNNFSVGGVQPSPATSGDMWYNTANSSLMEFNGTVWTGVMYEYVQDVQNQVAAASYGTNHPIFVAPNTGESWQIKAVSVVFGTASSSGTLQCEVATGTQAVGSGTNQLTGTVSLAGSANTTVNGTMIAAPTTITAGSRINLIFGGTLTNLLNCVVTVAIVKLS